MVSNFVHKEILKLICLSVAVLFLTGCASTNPYNIADGEGAYLKNSKVTKGKTTLFYAFTSGMTPDGKWVQFYEGNEARDHVIYKIPSGNISLGLKILYYYKGGPVQVVGDALDTSFKYLFSSKARGKLDSYMDHFEILVVNSKNPVGYLQGININAKEGNSYYINCKIQNGKALIWIEDQNGEPVSDMVRGVGYKHSKYWLWNNLPEPIY